MQKKQKDLFEEDDFEKLLNDFITQDFNQDDAGSEKEDEPEKLPFPPEIDDRIVGAMMRSDKSYHEEDSKVDDVDTIGVEVFAGYEKGRYTNAPVTVSIKPKKGCYLRQNRFKCYVYTDAYFPMCDSVTGCVNKRKGNRLNVEIPCVHVWLPGKYVLLILDSKTTLLRRIDFTLDDMLETTFAEPVVCHYSCIEDTLVSCIQGIDHEWENVSVLPGAAQLRRRVMDERRMMLYNEVRKAKVANEINTCGNLLICTINDDYDFDVLGKYQHMMFLDYTFCPMDASTLFDVMHTNPYEAFMDRLETEGMRVICLTHLGDLMGSSGKLIVRKISEKVRASRGRTLLWLCGSRQDIDSLLEMYPSLRCFFQKDSYLAQERYTPFELVQAIIRQMLLEHMEPNEEVKDRLTRTLLEGSSNGTLANLTLDAIRRFVSEEVRPRYLSRILPTMYDDPAPLLEEQDIPFDKLTNKATAFEESISELNGMVGLDNVKKGIMTMANRARFNQERRRRGLQTIDNGMFHSVFTGNPGTGKTTVARNLGKIYHTLGLLSKGDVIAVDRTRLVGQYIGQTEENMKTILEEAKGNVLFIDEAYTLSVGSDDRKDFGARVLDSLLTVLTQPNPDMLIVFAGYPKEMDAMLSSNPGLAGRFPCKYHFEDYTADQLLDIARHLLEHEEFVLTNEAAAALQESIETIVSHKLPNFGNARWVEQFVRNGIIPAMADRIYATGCDNFQCIEASDVRQAFEKYSPQAIELKPRHKVVSGFSA